MSMTLIECDVQLSRLFDIGGGCERYSLPADVKQLAMSSGFCDARV